MGTVGIIALAAGLSMDAFTVSVCKGLALGKARLRNAVIVGAWFGIFQAIMPLAGYLLGSAFSRFLDSFDHWIACGLLVIIGGNMIREACSEDDAGQSDASLSPAKMLLPAIATSIDALAVGVTFAFLNVPVLFAAGTIGAVAFICSAAGVMLGGIFGAHSRAKAELIGGIILAVLGIKILLDGLGVFGF